MNFTMEKTSCKQSTEALHEFTFPERTKMLDTYV